MLKNLFKTKEPQKLSKQDAEINFWRREIHRYQQWYSGELSPLYKSPSPAEEEKVSAPNLKDASILTWHKLHQEAKYLADLELSAQAFTGMKLLDVGAGPIPSATCFKGAELYCLEPLLPKYIEAGFPLHYYGNVTFIHSVSESIPVVDNFFDAVISVNAIDHVDDLPATALEISRVLKSDGLFRMHVHYHQPTVCEPVVINDQVFGELFSNCGQLRKVSETKQNFSTDLPNEESFVLWSNF